METLQTERAIKLVNQKSYPIAFPVTLYKDFKLNNNKTNHLSKQINRANYAELINTVKCLLPSAEREDLLVSSFFSFLKKQR